jgi:hypothetical protein
MFLLLAICPLIKGKCREIVNFRFILKIRLPALPPDFIEQE